MQPWTEERKEYYRLWRIRHKERLKVYNKLLYDKHKITIRTNAKIKYYKEKDNRDTSKFFKDRDDKRFINKMKALQLVSGKHIPECCICGIKDPRLLSINHINGDGHKDSKKYGNMAVAVNKGRDTSDLDVRCHNCNILYEYICDRRGPKNWEELYNKIIMN
jgi:hypothetical protein